MMAVTLLAGCAGGPTRKYFENGDSAAVFTDFPTLRFFIVVSVWLIIVGTALRHYLKHKSDGAVPWIFVGAIALFFAVVPFLFRYERYDLSRQGITHHKKGFPFREKETTTIKWSDVLSLTEYLERSEYNPARKSFGVHGGSNLGSTITQAHYLSVAARDATIDVNLSETESSGFFLDNVIPFLVNAIMGSDCEPSDADVAKLKAKIASRVGMEFSVEKMAYSRRK
jgi:hypothetical protein